MMGVDRRRGMNAAANTAQANSRGERFWLPSLSGEGLGEGLGERVGAHDNGSYQFRLGRCRVLWMHNPCAEYLQGLVQCPAPPIDTITRTVGLCKRISLLHLEG